MASELSREVAVKRLLKVKICMNCNARNPPNAKYCRKCKSRRLRRKKFRLEKRIFPGKSFYNTYKVVV